MFQYPVHILDGTQTKDTGPFGDTSGFQDVRVMSILKADEGEPGGIIEVSGFVSGRARTSRGNDEAMSVQEDLELFNIGIGRVGIEDMGEEEERGRGGEGGSGEG